MFLVNGVRRYKAGAALLFGFSDDKDGQTNIDIVAAALSEYGFELTIVDETDWNLSVNDGPRSRKQAEDQITFYLEDESDVVESDEKLLVVYFVGHGHIERTAKGSEARRAGIQKVLIGSNVLRNGQGVIELDISKLQEHARGSTGHDVLFLVEACSGQINGMANLHFEDRPSTRDGEKRMEVITAGWGLIYVRGSASDFARRFAAILKSDVDPPTVNAMVNAMNNHDNYVKLFHWRESGNEGITLMPILTKREIWQARFRGLPWAWMAGYLILVQSVWNWLP